jgi:isopenicillin-N epimerase
MLPEDTWAKEMERSAGMAEGEGDGGLRSEFLLRPEVIFLNHGSFGACPRPVFEVYQEWQRELERQPVEFLGRRGRGLLREAAARLAGYVGAEADDLVFVTNSTFAVNIVARSLPLDPGDEVLGTEHEYGACERAWQLACSQRGARYRRAALPLPMTSVEETVEAFWSHVTPKTRVVFLSHITSPTAAILPVAAIIRRARAAGIWTVIDGAHAPGQIDLDLRALDADFYAGNCHKWLCSPKGAGFLYARRDLQPLLVPLVVSWGRTSGTVEPFQIGSFVHEHEGQGTRDISAFLSVPAAIDFQQQRDWPRVRQECHVLARWTREQIAELTGLAPLVPDSPEWYAQMAACPLPPCDAAQLKERLYDDYRIEVPITTWRGHQSVRVSVQGYNTRADVEALLAALGQLLPTVRVD